MVHELVMPMLGLTMTSGVVGTWRKKEGDSVRSGEVVLEIESEKYVHEIVSEVDGVLSKIIVETGKEVPVKTVLGIVGDSAGASVEAAGSSDIKDLISDYTDEGVPSFLGGAAINPMQISGLEKKPQPVMHITPDAALVTSQAASGFITPAARKLAVSKGVNISSVTGTGPKGRVTVEDVEMVIKKTTAQGAWVTETATAASVSSEAPYKGCNSPGDKDIEKESCVEGKLQGRVALIVGSAKGIGKAIAQELASEGASVIVTGIHTDIGIATTQELRDKGAAAEYLSLDVSDPARCEVVVAETVKLFGKLDILICNSGVAAAGSIESTTLKTWDKMFDVNIRSYFTIVKCALPHLVASGNGCIVFNSSLAGIKAMQMSYVYGATKAAMVNFTKNLALGYAAQNVRVNAVAPGNIMTDIFAGRPDELLDKMAQAIPMKRFGQPEEVAKVVKFLVSDDASYITGQIIGVTGGLDL